MSQPSRASRAAISAFLSFTALVACLGVCHQLLQVKDPLPGVSVHGLKGRSNYGWFWDKNFTDGTVHDNDAEREFFRHHSRSPPVQTTPTGDDTSSASETQEHHLDKSSYYKQRKQQALACKTNEHVKLTLDDFGGVGCQMCTCNSQGMMLCTHIACKEGGEDVARDQDHILDTSVHTNKDLRGIADGCEQGTTEKVGKCTCTCVLPKVLSCPKACFYERENGDTTTHHYNDNTDITPADFGDSTYITTEDYNDNTGITTEDYNDNTGITTENYDDGTHITTEDNNDSAGTTPEDTTTKDEFEDSDDTMDKEEKEDQDEEDDEETRHQDKGDEDDDNYLYILINFGHRAHKTKKNHKDTAASAVRA